MLEKIKPHIPYTALLFILMALVYYPFLIPQQSPLMAGDFLSMWWEFKTFVLSAFKSGEFPLWNPFIFCGYPFLAAGQAGVFYPPDMLFLMVKNTLWMFHLNVAFHVFLFGAGVYFLFISWGLKRFSAFAGAVVMMLSGQVSAHIYAGHYPHLHSIAFMPWTLFFLKKSFQSSPGKRKIMIPLCGISLSLQILSGFPQYTYYTVQMMGAFVIYEIFLQWNKHPGWYKRFTPLIIFIAVAALASGLGAIQLFPSLEVSGYFNRSAGSFRAVAVTGSFEPVHLTRVLNPNFLGHPADENFRKYQEIWHWWEMCPYMGIIPFFMAILSIPFYIIRRKKNYSFIFWGMVSFISIIMALGNNTPFYNLLLKIIPGLSFFRVPARYLLFFNMGLAFLFSYFLEQFSFIKKYIVSVFILILVCGDLIYTAHNIIYSKFPVRVYNPALMNNTPPVRYLKKDLGFFRILGLNNITFYNEPMITHLFTPAGYDAVFLDNYNRFLNIIENNKKNVPYISPEIRNYRSHLFPFLNVKYIFTGSGDKITEPFFKEVFRDRYLRIYEDERVLPRFYFVPELIVKKDSNGIIDALKNTDCKINERAYVTRKSKLKPFSINRDKLVTNIIVKKYKYNRIELDTVSNNDAFLVTSEVYYPGWKLKIDDVDKPIYETNRAFRGFPVPAGKHTIVMTFSPFSFKLGVIITLLSIIGLIIHLLNTGREKEE